MLCSKRRKNFGRGYRKPSNRKSNYSKRRKSLGRGRRKCSTRKSKYSKRINYALSRVKQIGGDVRVGVLPIDLRPLENEPLHVGKPAHQFPQIVHVDVKRSLGDGMPKDDYVMHPVVKPQKSDPNPIVSFTDDGQYVYQVNYDTLTSLDNFMDYLHKFDKEATVVGYKLDQELWYSGVEEDKLDKLKQIIAKAFEGYDYKTKVENDEEEPTKKKYTVTYDVQQNTDDSLPTEKIDTGQLYTEVIPTKSHFRNWYTIHIQTTVEDALEKYKKYRNIRLVRK